MHQLLNLHLLSENSPKKAFYNIFVLDAGDRYVVRKESGAAGKVLDIREWSRPTREEAAALFFSIVRAKTNPERKSPRHYQIVDLQLSLF